MKPGGAIRIIDTNGSCKGGEVKLTWNQKGQPGTNRTNGTNGTNGVSGYEVVTKTQEETNASAFFGSVRADCPPGKNVTGGGALVDANGGVQDGFRVLQDGPTSNNAGWQAVLDISNPLDDPFTIRVFAFCATVTP